jgi:hypothetical protein
MGEAARKRTEEERLIRRLRQAQARRGKGREMSLILRGQRRTGANCGRGDETIDSRPTPAARLIIYSGGRFRFNHTKVNNSIFQNESRIAYLLRGDGAIQEFAPCYRANSQYLARAQPIHKLSLKDRGLGDQSNKVIGIEVNHRRLVSEARRSRRTSALNLAAVLAESPPRVF